MNSLVPGLVLLLIVEECGCVSGVYRDPKSGLIADNYGYYDMCDEHLAWYEDEARRECEAELRNEQFWENRGYEEARAEEEREARAGILSYEAARDLAMGRGW